MALKVKDVMVGEVVTIGASVTVREAVRLMNKHEIGCLVVEDEEEKPVGIVTERDMLKRVLVATRDPRAVEVGEVMSKPLLFMEPEKEIEDAVKLMFKHKIKKLPVIKNGRLVGLVTLTDLIRSRARNLKDREIGGALTYPLLLATREEIYQKYAIVTALFSSVLASILTVVNVLVSIFK